MSELLNCTFYFSLSFWIILLWISILISITILISIIIKRSRFKLPDTWQHYGVSLFLSYALMCECWSNEPDRRPTFESISRTIKRLERCHKVSPIHSSLYITYRKLYFWGYHKQIIAVITNAICVTIDTFPHYYSYNALGPKKKKKRLSIIYFVPKRRELYLKITWALNSFKSTEVLNLWGTEREKD